MKQDQRTLFPPHDRSVRIQETRVAEIPLPQSQALNSAGCAEIFEEQASGGDRARPMLARLGTLTSPSKTTCDQLEAMRERTPSGRTTRQPSSVKMLQERAGKFRLLESIIYRCSSSHRRHHVLRIITA